MKERLEYRVVTTGPDGEERRTICYDMRVSAEEMARRARMAGQEARLERRVLQVGEWAAVEEQVRTTD